MSCFSKFLAFAIALLLGACSTFKVTNSEGLREAFSDIDSACSAAVELRNRSDVSPADRRVCATLYRKAQAAVNSYLKQVVVDAADYDVNATSAHYEKLGARKAVQLFRERVESLGVTRADVAVWIPVAVEVIGLVRQFHAQEQRAAYERFVATINSYLMKNFEDLPGETAAESLLGSPAERR